MDKLQPLIVHRFWIITSLSLILSLTGWWFGTGDLEKDYEAKASMIDGAFSGLPNPTTNPNDRWTDRLGKVNDVQQEALNESAKSLWDRQQSLMFWPSDMPDMMSENAET